MRKLFGEENTDNLEAAKDGSIERANNIDTF
jgi:hypothetical protein